jgi:tetratricopeptide (TPR) repeat protein
MPRRGNNDEPSLWKAAEDALRVAVMEWERVGGGTAHRGLELALTRIFRRAVSVLPDFSLLPVSLTKPYGPADMSELFTRHGRNMVLHGTVEINEAGTGIEIKVKCWTDDGDPRVLTPQPNKSKGVAICNRLKPNIWTTTTGNLQDLSDMVFEQIEKNLELAGIEIDEERYWRLSAGHPARGEHILVFGQALYDLPSNSTVQTLDFLGMEDPSFALPLLVQAGLCFSSDHHLAERYLCNAIEYDPYNPDGYITLARLMREQFSHRNREALNVLEDCFQIAPADGRAHRMAGLLLSTLNRPNEALDHLELAATLLSGSPDVLIDFANVLWKDFGEIEKAEEAFRKAVRLAPREARYSAELSELLDELGRKDDALEYADRSCFLAEEAMSAVKETDEAEKQKARNEFVRYAFLWAETAYNYNEDEVSLEALKKLLSVDPKHHLGRMLRQTIERRR